MNFLCDKDLARLLGVSTSTITRAVRNETPKDSIVSKMRPVYVGCARRWKIDDVARATGMSVEDIRKELS